MKCYDASPPWSGSSRYGWWSFTPASADDWFQEPGHWLLMPPETNSQTLSRIMKLSYLPLMTKWLNSPMLVLGKEAPPELPKHPS